MLQLPSEADIARDIGRDVDPDAIFAARVRAARAASGRGSAPALRETYRRHGRRGAVQSRTPRAPGAAR